MLNSPLFDAAGLVTSLPTPVGFDRAAIMILVHELATSLGKAIDAKDPHTLAHSEEVADMARVLAMAMGLGDETAHAVHVAGHLHDIGKLGVPDAVLGKPGRLTPDEWERMKAHPAMGAAILSPLSCLADIGVVGMVQAHHERFDGQGYPHGLRGRAIPLGARIIAVADSLSAMLQARPYRPAMAFDAAAAEIVRCAGAQFDPAVVAAFSGVREDLRRLSRSFRRPGQAA